MSTFKQLKMEQRLKKAQIGKQDKARKLLTQILGTDELVGEALGIKFSGPTGFVDAFITSIVPKLSTTHDFDVYAVGQWYANVMEHDSSAYRSLAGNLINLMGCGASSKTLYVRRCNYESGFSKTATQRKG
jgi:hypothetical protein